VLACYDLGLIRARSKSTSLPAAEELYVVAAKRRWLHIYSSIFSVITIGGAAIAIYKYPDLFISQHWHLIPISAVLLWTVLLLVNEFRMFNGLREGIMVTAGLTIQMIFSKNPSHYFLFTAHCLICNFQRFVQHSEAFLQLFLGDNQRRDDHRRVPVNIQEQTVIEAIIFEGGHLRT